MLPPPRRIAFNGLDGRRDGRGQGGAHEEKKGRFTRGSVGVGVQVYEQTFVEHFQTEPLLQLWARHARLVLHSRVVIFQLDTKKICRLNMMTVQSTRYRMIQLSYIRTKHLTFRGCQVRSHSLLRGRLKGTLLPAPSVLTVETILDPRVHRRFVRV